MQRPPHFALGERSIGRLGPPSRSRDIHRDDSVETRIVFLDARQIEIEQFPDPIFFCLMSAASAVADRNGMLFIALLPGASRPHRSFCHAPRNTAHSAKTRPGSGSSFFPAF